MPRLFVPEHIEREGKSLEVSGNEAHYILNVIRLKPGEDIVVVDNSGVPYSAEISAIGRKSATLMIKERLPALPEPRLNITLIQGMLKNEKMDLVVQKATELGVSRLIPAITERSQLRTTRKTPRWRTIAMEAARQCGRGRSPLIADPVDFSEALEKGSRGIIFWEESDVPLSRTLDTLRAAKEVVVAIGPEGGFSRQEVSNAEDAGLTVASLGVRILRAETAAITALSIMQYELGDIDPEQVH